jgi:hypothetical protein
MTPGSHLLAPDKIPVRRPKSLAMRTCSVCLLVSCLAFACGGGGSRLSPGAGGAAGDDLGGDGGEGGSAGGQGGNGGKGGAGGSSGSGEVAGTSGGGTSGGGASGAPGGASGSGEVAGTSGGGTSGAGGDTGGAGGGGGDVDAGSAPDTAPVGDGGIVISAIPPGMTQIFDGKTLMGWTGSTAIWSVDATEMAIHGKTGNGGQLLKSAGDYDDFRLILTEKAVATTNHMGICFWGSRPGNGYGGCLDAIPPSGHFWDYGGGGDVPNTGVGSANNDIKFIWHQVEILATASTGEVLVAVNGKQVTTYKKPGRGKKGPIGLQAHAGASDQMYKDIWVEMSPKEHKLLTVK